MEQFITNDRALVPSNITEYAQLITKESDGHGNSSNHNLLGSITVADYASPIILLIFFLFAYGLRSIIQERADSSNKAEAQYGPGGKLLPSKKPAHSKEHVQALDFSKNRKRFFNCLAILTGLTFCANAGVVIIRALAQRKEQWWCGQAYTVYVVGNFFVYSLLVLSLFDTNPSPTTAHLATWTCAVIMELVMTAASISVYSQAHREHRAWKHHGLYSGPMASHMTDWELVEVLIDVSRILCLALFIAMYLIFVVSRNAQIREAREAAQRREAGETTGLLDGEGNANGHSYGTNNQRPQTPAPAGWERPTKTPARGWWEYLKSYAIFLPFLWPYKDRKLQLIVLFCVVLVGLQRVVNILVPIETSKITNILAGEDGTARLPWEHIFIYIVLRYLQGSQGLIGAIRGNLWIPISQYSFRELSVASFEHVHSLSLDFHLGKKTGEVISALGKGTSINTFLEQVTFQVLPMIVDLVFAVGYFLFVFDAYYALVVAIVTFWYIYITIRMARWRADIRRDMVNADREEDAVKNDSIVSYETVKYFNAEPWEFGRYQGAVRKFQKAEYRVLQSLNLMNVAQNSVFTFGLLVVCFLAAYQVSSGQRKIGDFAALLQYMVQLQQPLNFFGTFYRMIQTAMINAERLLELFKEKPTVVDTNVARPLPSCEGAISFKDVNFAYDSRKPALNGLDFECKPGTTTALVGESGGGKSTVFRLLFRFYNQITGSIQIDGHDVQGLTIDSLRKHIGVVPQDTVLFNETLMYNLKYANQNVTDEQVFEACRAASIHEKIMGFPDGYNTKVGERGLRLSGGEKQRVAIARTILKDPRIILLDEATAALDTDTEQHIQEAFTTLGTGRTMLIIAHRLSTITSADQILVLRNGKVAERGTHEELLAAKGHYASMWKKQVRAQRAAEEAKTLQDKADRLRAEVGQEGGPSSGETSANHSDDDSHKESSSRDTTVRRDFGHSREASSGSNLPADDESSEAPSNRPFYISRNPQFARSFPGPRPFSDNFEHHPDPIAPDRGLSWGEALPYHLRLN